MESGNAANSLLLQIMAPEVQIASFLAVYWYFTAPHTTFSTYRVWASEYYISDLCLPRFTFV